MKINRIYSDLLQAKVVTTDDIVELVKLSTDLDPNPQYVYNKYIKPLMGRGALSRVRRGLYYVNSPNEVSELDPMDKYLIGAKIRSRYYLSHHAALELHGCAQSVFWTVHVSLPQESRFQEFEFRGVRFQPVSTKNVDIGIISFSWRDKPILTSNPNRTFIDCVDRPDLVGGWEECLKSLQSLPGVRVEEMANIINEMNKKTLYNKTGYILELLKDNSVYYEHITDDELETIRNMVSRNPVRLRGSGKVIRSQRWNLWVEEGFEEYLRGV